MNFDFSKLSSQVPAKGSLACAERQQRVVTAVARINTRVALRNVKNMAILLQFEVAIMIYIKLAVTQKLPGAPPYLIRFQVG